MNNIQKTRTANEERQALQVQLDRNQAQAEQILKDIAEREAQRNEDERTALEAERLEREEIEKEQVAIAYKASLKARYSLAYGNYAVMTSINYGEGADKLDPTEREEFFNSVRVPIASNKYIKLYKRGTFYELETNEHQEPLLVSTNIFEAMRTANQLNLKII